MERLAGAVERFVCGSGGRVEASKCRAVLGTAFAGGGSKLDGRGDDGVRLCGVASVGLGGRAGCANGAKRSAAPLWFWVCRVGYEQRRRESQHGCSSATCGEWSLCGGGSEPGGRGDDGVKLCGVISVGLWRWFCLGVGLVAQTERSGVRRLWRVLFSSWVDWWHGHKRRAGGGCCFV